MGCHCFFSLVFLTYMDECLSRMENILWSEESLNGFIIKRWFWWNICRHIFTIRFVEMLLAHWKCETMRIKMFRASSNVSVVHDIFMDVLCSRLFWQQIIQWLSLCGFFIGCQNRCVKTIIRFLFWRQNYELWLEWLIELWWGKH